MAKSVIAKAAAKSATLATAESCTGGLIAAALTDVPGASAVLDRGFVTYSNTAKIQMLGVPADVIVTNGAVSEETADAMARGAIAKGNISLCVSVTGIAGPGGGSRDKPVGLVWFGYASDDGKSGTEKRLFAPQSRAFVRAETTKTALQFLLREIERR